MSSLGYKCEMLTEIFTIESGKKDVSSLEGTTLSKNYIFSLLLLNIIAFVFL